MLANVLSELSGTFFGSGAENARKLMPCGAWERKCKKHNLRKTGNYLFESVTKCSHELFIFETWTPHF